MENNSGTTCDLNSYDKIQTIQFHTFEIEILILWKHLNHTTKLPTYPSMHHTTHDESKTTINHKFEISTTISTTDNFNWWLFEQRWPPGHKQLNDQMFLWFRQKLKYIYEKLNLNVFQKFKHFFQRHLLSIKPCRANPCPPHQSAFALRVSFCW